MDSPIPHINRRTVNRVVLLVLLCTVSVVFIGVIRPFLMAIFMSAFLSALCHPIYRRLAKLFGDRQSLASITTVVMVTFFVVTPLSIVLGIAMTQALGLIEDLLPHAQAYVSNPELLTQRFELVPFHKYWSPYQGSILTKLQELAGSGGTWIVQVLGGIVGDTLHAALMGLVVLYTTYFFLIDGRSILRLFLFYLPLNNDDENLLLDRFASVGKATLKGTAVIGFIQGTLAGLALWAAGIDQPLFWAVAMMFLSVVPGVGATLVWFPASLFLFFSGDKVAGLAVGGFCAVVVGTVDNVLRPILVGKDTQLHELLIFFSTLGGISVFGFFGFIIGPMIAALCVTLWQIYGEEFKDWLPPTFLFTAEKKGRKKKSFLRKNRS